MPRAGRVVLHRVVPFHVKISFSFPLLWRHRERLSSISEPARVGVAPEMKKKNQEKALKRIEVPPCFYSRFSATSEDTHTHTHTNTLCSAPQPRQYPFGGKRQGKRSQASVNAPIPARSTATKTDRKRERETERERESWSTRTPFQGRRKETDRGGPKKSAFNNPTTSTMTAVWA